MPLQFLDSVPPLKCTLEYLRDGTHPVLSAIKRDIRSMLIAGDLNKNKPILQEILSIIRDLEQRMPHFYHTPSLAHAHRLKDLCLQMPNSFEKLSPPLKYSLYIANIESAYLHFHEKFIQEIESYIKYTLRAQANISTSKLNTRADKLYASKYLILPLSHRDIPLLSFTGGLCYGIALTTAYGILQHESIEQITLVKILKNVESNNIVKLYRIHSSQRAFHCSSETTHTTQELSRLTFFKAFAAGKLESNTAYDAAQEIANKINELMLIVTNDNKYAFQLNLRPLCYDSNGPRGHSLSFAVKNNQYYMVDASSGVYCFDNIVSLHEFVGWYLYKTRYAQRYFSYNITNFPQMEHEFPMPTSLSAKCIPQTALTYVTSEYSTLSFMRNRSSNIIADIQKSSDLMIERCTDNIKSYFGYNL